MATRTDEWILRLREFDNPFSAFVEVRTASRSFRRWHVPEVNADAMRVLANAVARYRKAAEDPREAALGPPRSGILVVYGPRGSGKTHLLHALEGEDVATLVAPAHFDPMRYHNEYLLHQLVRTLQEETDDRESPLLGLAEWFTRRALRVVLSSLDEADWLLHQAAARLSFWRVEFGAPRGDDLADPRTVARDLATYADRRLPDALRRIGQEPRVLASILGAWIDQTHPGRAVPAQIERRLYQHLVTAALGVDEEGLGTFLEDGFTDVRSRVPPAREVLVDALLQTLTHLLFLQGMPVIFAFDALEALLGDPPSPEVEQRFSAVVANAADAQPAILYFVFAESNYWEHVRANSYEYAMNRFDQGTPVLHQGNIREVNLAPASRDSVVQIVRTRLAPLRDALGSGWPNDGVWPFGEDDIDDIAGGAYPPPLRFVLQSLCDRYDELVFGRVRGERVQGGDGRVTVAAGSQGSAARAARDAAERLEGAWRTACEEAERQIGGGSASGWADALLQGFAAWMTLCLARREGSRSLAAVEQTTFGNHPTYGQMLLATWRLAGADHRQGIGFWLGQRHGMPRDLEVKLKGPGSGEPPVDSLLLLWPRESRSFRIDPGDLPAASGRVWRSLSPDRARPGIRIASVEPRDLVGWLAIPVLRRRLREEGVPWDDAILAGMLCPADAALLDLLVPEGGA